MPDPERERLVRAVEKYQFWWTRQWPWWRRAWWSIHCANSDPLLDAELNLLHYDAAHPEEAK